MCKEDLCIIALSTLFVVTHLSGSKALNFRIWQTLRLILLGSVFNSELAKLNMLCCTAHPVKHSSGMHEHAVLGLHGLALVLFAVSRYVPCHAS